jgi:hypothetical protein
MANAAAAAFLAGLMSGGLRGYQLSKDFEERDLDIAKKKQAAADDAALRAAASPDGSQSSGQGIPGIAQQITSSTLSAGQNTPSDAGASPSVWSGPNAPESGNAVPIQALVPASSQSASASQTSSATAPTGGLGAPNSISSMPAASERDRILQRFASDDQASQLPQIAGAITQGGQSGPAGIRIALGDMRQKKSFSADTYLENTAPRVISTLVRQGKFDDAKKYSDFVDSQQGRQYTRAWTAGTRALALGDTAGALRSFQTLYNQSLPDGNTVRLSPIDGQTDTFKVEQFDGDGNLLGSRQGSGQQIASAAALYLSPTEAVRHFAAADEKRAQEIATAAQQMQLERLRGSQAMDRTQAQITAADQRADRQSAAADQRADRQSAAADQRLTRQLDAKAQGGGLTQAQQRSNLEIAAARQATAGMTPEELRRRTAPTTATGRENPDFDPGLAHTAALARRRKIGQDDEFNNANRTPAPNRQEVVTRFQQDRAMFNFKLGQQTARGIEVLDSAGKLQGYYR